MKKEGTSERNKETTKDMHLNTTKGLNNGIQKARQSERTKTRNT